MNDRGFSSNERMRQVATLLSNGMSRQEVADHLGLDLSSVAKYASALGLAGTSKRPDPDLGAMIKDLRAKGLSQQRIADQLGLTQPRVSGYLRRMAEAMNRRSPMENQVVEPKTGEEWVISNPRNCDFHISDLGIKSPSGTFTCETIGPFQTKDLAKIYSPRELRNCHYIKVALNAEPPLLVRGRLTEEQKQAELDPLTRMAKANPTGSFADPMSGVGRETGTRFFDEKLKELREADAQEDEDTKKH